MSFEIFFFESLPHKKRSEKPTTPRGLKNKNGIRVLRATPTTPIQRPRREDLLFCLVVVVVLDFFFFFFVERKRRRRRKKSGDFLFFILERDSRRRRRRNRVENEIGHLIDIRRRKSHDGDDVLGETLGSVSDFFPTVRGGHGPGGSEETFEDDLSRRSMHDERSKHGRDETEDHRRG